MYFCHHNSLYIKAYATTQPSPAYLLLSLSLAIRYFSANNYQKASNHKPHRIALYFDHSIFCHTAVSDSRIFPNFALSQ